MKRGEHALSVIHKGSRNDRAGMYGRDGGGEPLDKPNTASRCLNAHPDATFSHVPLVADCTEANKSK